MLNFIQVKTCMCLFLFFSPMRRCYGCFAYTDSHLRWWGLRWGGFHLFCLNVEKLVQSVQLLSHVRLFATPWTAARQASLSITNSQSLPKLTSIELVMPSNHLILSSVVPFSSRLQSFPTSGSFPISQFFASGSQRIGVSASTSARIFRTDFL